MSQDEIKNNGFDIEEFLEFFLQDSQEQVEKLGAGLLQLEKDGENLPLINELFRCAHSLKGASGTMGFTPIVQLTHAAEDILDRLRQGKMNPGYEVIDILLAVTDKVKSMLAQVEQRKEISNDFEDLVAQMKSLVETSSANVALSSEAEKIKQEDNDSEHIILDEKVKDDSEENLQAGIEKEDKQGVFSQKDFGLNAEENEVLNDAVYSGKNIYQLDVAFEPNTLMKAVRAVMVLQKLENMGRVVKSIPAIDDLENDNAEGFSVLLLSNEPADEIISEIMQVSEIDSVNTNNFVVSDSKTTEKVQDIEHKIEETKTVDVKIDESPKQEESPFVDGLKTVEQQTAVDNIVKDIPKSPPTQKAEVQQDTKNGQVHTIRVETARLDNLINLVGEMVITRTRLVKISNDLKNHYQSDLMIGNLNETNLYLGRLMSDLQESVMRLRMVPVGTVFSRFPRLVRDFCRKTGKKIDLIIKGEETELDKTVIELIGDPLTHLIRNSVDHGLETPEERIAAGKNEMGTITMDAYHEGNHIAIIVSDDGKGLDLEKIYNVGLKKGLISSKDELTEREIANLIFLPGFSTADKITDISGRGVGMDVVKKALNSLGGLVDIKTSKGVGTSFIIRLPLTLAIIQALLVEVGKEVYAVPLSSVLETLLIKKEDIKSVGGIPMVQLRGNTLPLISLGEKFNLPETVNEKEEAFVVVVGLGDKAIGLIVDELQGQQEIVIKSLGDFLNNLPGIAGATILGDGQVTLILDIGSLIQDVLIAY